MVSSSAFSGKHGSFHIPESANSSTKYVVLSKVYTNEGGVKLLNRGLSACTGDNPLAKARGLSPRTGGQNMVRL